MSTVVWDHSQIIFFLEVIGFDKDDSIKTDSIESVISFLSGFFLDKCKCITQETAKNIYGYYVDEIPTRETKKLFCQKRSLS